MREIKFRGKRANNGKWVFGYYKYSKILNEHIIVGEDDCVSYPVIPETVGQYTGLKDKNGVEICEGDILSGEFYYRGEGWYDTGEGEFTINDPVIFDDGKFTCRGFDLCEMNDEVKVIGNIHDNPELVEGKK